MGQVRQEIRQAIEARIAELRPFVAELELLISILRMIEDPTKSSSETAESIATVLANLTSDAPRAAGPPKRPRTQRVGTRPGSDGRAPIGSNRTRIIATVRAEPGVTPTEISRLTGIKRTVVSSTVSRMKRKGDLEPHGRRGVRLAEGGGP